MSAALDFHTLMSRRDIDARIRESRDGLMAVMQSEHKRLETKIDSSVHRLESKIDVSIQMQDKRFAGLETRMDKMETRIDRMETRMDGIHVELLSMKKWTIGLMVGVFLAITGLAVPMIISLVS